MKKQILISALALALGGCATSTPTALEEVRSSLNKAHKENVSAGLNELPEGVIADLQTSSLVEKVAFKSPTEKRLQIKADEVEANAFFTSLLSHSPYNVMIHPDVTGLLTLNLQQVTLQEALDAVSEMYGYPIKKQGKLIQIFPATLRTEVFPVNYLNLTRQGQSVIRVSNGSISDKASDKKGGTSIESQTDSQFWPQLAETVAQIIGNDDGRRVSVSPQVGLLTVRALPNELRDVQHFLGLTDERLKRQVILEAKILEVTLNNTHEQGINWENLSGTLGGALISLDRLPSLTDKGGQTNITIQDGEFQGVLRFLQTQGQLNVLSSPRVTAINNQKAVIKVGGDQYFVTDIEGGEVNSDGGMASPDIELTPFFSGISLDVMPQIDDKGGVLLHVHPTVVDVSTDDRAIDLGELLGTYDLPLAKSTIRESDSVIYARSGEVVVIGGLMKTVDVDQVNKVPLLGDIPILGQAFRNTQKLKQKTELVILIKPTLVGANTWAEQVARSEKLLSNWLPNQEG